MDRNNQKTPTGRRKKKISKEKTKAPLAGKRGAIWSEQMPAQKKKREAGTTSREKGKTTPPKRGGENPISKMAKPGKRKSASSKPTKAPGRKGNTPKQRTAGRLTREPSLVTGGIKKIRNQG